METTFFYANNFAKTIHKDRSSVVRKIDNGMESTRAFGWFGYSGRIPRLSLNQHSLYVGVVEKPPPPPLTGEQYGKMEPKYHEGGHCQSILRPQRVFNVPLYFK